MGIFKNVTRLLKKAAPVIGGSIGFMIGGPLGSAAIGSALGAGIGSLVGGADTDDALKAALLGGIGGYAASGGNFFTPTAGSAAGTAGVTGSAANITGPEIFDPTTVTAVKQAGNTGIMSTLKDFATSPTGIATIGGLGTLAALSGEEEEKATTTEQKPFPKGTTRLGMGRIGNKSYNLDNEEERKKYFEDLREKQGIMPRDREVGIDPIFSASGGEVEGPGTGTSDSVPAMLSDGEFVLTAKAVRGAGGGDRDIGAARMYDMMSELERVA
jgi:hypothetical protein